MVAESGSASPHLGAGLCPAVWPVERDSRVEPHTCCFVMLVLHAMLAIHRDLRNGGIRAVPLGD